MWPRSQRFGRALKAVWVADLLTEAQDGRDFLGFETFEQISTFPKKVRLPPTCVCYARVTLSQRFFGQGLVGKGGRLALVGVGWQGWLGGAVFFFQRFLRARYLGEVGAHWLAGWLVTSTRGLATQARVGTARRCALVGSLPGRGASIPKWT